MVYGWPKLIYVSELQAVNLFTNFLALVDIIACSRWVFLALLLFTPRCFLLSIINICVLEYNYYSDISTKALRLYN